MEAHTYYTGRHGQLALLHDGMKTHSMQMTETLYRNPKKEKHIHSGDQDKHTCTTTTDSHLRRQNTHTNGQAPYPLKITPEIADGHGLGQKLYKLKYITGDRSCN